MRNKAAAAPMPTPNPPRRSICVSQGMRVTGTISGGSSAPSAYTRASSKRGLSIFIRTTPFPSDDQLRRFLHAKQPAGFGDLFEYLIFGQLARDVTAIRTLKFLVAVNGQSF